MSARSRRARPLRAQLRHRLAGVAAASVLCTVAVDYAITQQAPAPAQARAQATQESTEQEGARIAARLGEALDHQIVERLRDAHEWAAAPTVIEGARAGARGDTPMRRYLRAARARAREFHWIRISDRHGRDIATTNGKPRKGQASERWWQEAWSDGARIGEVAYDEQTGEWAVPIAMRVDDAATGEPVGVLSAALGIASVQSTAERWAAEESAQIEVRDRNARALAQSAPQPAGGTSEATRETGGRGGYAALVRGADFEGLRWTVTVRPGADTQAAQGAAPAQGGVGEVLGRWKRWAAAGAGIVLALALAPWAAGGVARPIERLHARSAALVGADKRRGGAAAKGDEIAQIDDAFGRMEEIVRKAIRKLRERGRQTG